MDWSLEGQLAHLEEHGTLQLYDPDALALDSLTQHDHHANLNSESPRARQLHTVLYGLTPQDARPQASSTRSPRTPSTSLNPPLSTLPPRSSSQSLS
jgi:hypothetical protein